jgi:hypothetical protein
MPVDPTVRVRFTAEANGKDATGKPSRVIVTIGGKELTAQRHCP